MINTLVVFARGLVTLPLLVMALGAQEAAAPRQRLVMPPLVGLRIDSAVRVLNNLKLPRPKIERVAHAEARGTVIDQSPQPKQPISREGIVLVVSIGPRPGAIDSQPPPPSVKPPPPDPVAPPAVPPAPVQETKYVKVPSLIELTYESAKLRLDSAGLHLGAVHDLPRPAGNGLVALQGPVAGTQVLLGTAVAIWLATPPEMIPPDTIRPPREDIGPVPSVLGLRRDQAESVLVAAGFRLGSVTPALRRGTIDSVIGQQPAAGDTAEAGTRVAIQLAVPAAAPPAPPQPDSLRQPIEDRGGGPVPWPFIVAPLLAIVAAVATFATTRQGRRDWEWKRRLEFVPRSSPATPTLASNTNPIDRRDLRLVPRAGLTRSAVVGDGAFSKGEPR